MLALVIYKIGLSQSKNDLGAGFTGCIRTILISPQGYAASPALHYDLVTVTLVSESQLQPLVAHQHAFHMQMRSDICRSDALYANVNHSDVNCLP